MKIMAITRRVPGATVEKIQALQVPEATMVWKFITENLIREIYFDADKPCVVLMLVCASKEEAAMRLASLPMVEQKQIDFDYYTLGPYTQLSNLFATSQV